MSQAGIAAFGVVPPPPGTVETLTGNTGGAVSPDIFNNIDIVGVGPITVAGNPGINTLSIIYNAPSADVFFSAFKSATTANATGDGTTVTVIFDTAPSNIGAAYNVATGIFTAPTTGLYQFFHGVTVTNVGALHNAYEVAFAGSAESINTDTVDVGTAFSPILSNSYSSSASVIIQMTAGDTMAIQATASGSTKTIGIYGAALPGYLTWFRGCKIA